MLTYRLTSVKVPERRPTCRNERCYRAGCPPRARKTASAKKGLRREREGFRRRRNPRERLPWKGGKYGKRSAGNQLPARKSPGAGFGRLGPVRYGSSRDTPRGGKRVQVPVRSRSGNSSAR